MKRHTLHFDGTPCGTWPGNTPDESWDAYLESEHRTPDGKPRFGSLDEFLASRGLSRNGSTPTSVPDRPRPHITAAAVND